MVFHTLFKNIWLTPATGVLVEETGQRPGETQNHPIIANSPQDHPIIANSPRDNPIIANSPHEWAPKRKLGSRHIDPTYWVRGALILLIGWEEPWSYLLGKRTPAQYVGL